MQPVAYIWSQELQAAADHLPSNIGRSSIVHALTKALDLLSGAPPTSDNEDEAFPGPAGPADEGRQRATIVPPDRGLGTLSDLRRYHTPDYVDYLMGDAVVAGGESADSDASSGSSETYRAVKRRKTEKHGLEYDCPAFPSLPQYATLIASSTLTACRIVARGEAGVAINWDGGRHHALRNKASGFCYVADIVLGIMLLLREGHPSPAPSADAGEASSQSARPRRRKPRVMYLDFDLHYGDGIAQAFHSPTAFRPGQTTKPGSAPQVLTLSVHHSAPFFFPPPSALSLLPGPDTPHPFSLSIPLRAYPSAATYRALWPSVEAVYQAFTPDYVVLQLGADGLPGDPVGQWGNWTWEGEGGMAWVARKVAEWGKRTVVLGGGGYAHANTARAWAGVTAELLDRPLDGQTDIPHHDHFPEYAPSFTMEVPAGRAKDENTDAHLESIRATYSTLASRIADIVQPRPTSAIPPEPSLPRPTLPANSSMTSA